MIKGFDNETISEAHEFLNQNSVYSNTHRSQTPQNFERNTYSARGGHGKSNRHDELNNRNRGDQIWI